MKILKPDLSKIYALLRRKRAELERRIQQLSLEDPFQDKDRLLDNAASDTEAREEVGHERIEALKNELMKNIELVKKALSNIGIGRYGLCESCHQPINKGRLQVFPEATFCIVCEQKRETT